MWDIENFTFLLSFNSLCFNFAQLFNCVSLFATLWIVAYQAPLSTWDFPGKNTEWVAISSCMGSSNPRIEPASSALAGRFFTTEPPGKPCNSLITQKRQQKWVVNKNEKWERSYSRENQVKCKRMLLAQCVSMSNKKREGVSHYLSSWMVLSSLGVCCKVILKALLIEKAKQWDWRFNWDGHRKEKKWQNMKEMVSTFIQF